MKRFIKAVFALIAAVSLSAGCSSDQSTFTAVEDDLTACPASSDEAAKSSASLAYTLARHAAKAGCGDVILAPQMYRLSEQGIEFDPDGPFYGKVTQQMKDALVLAQLEPGVGEFLAKGLVHKQSNTFAKLHKDLVAGFATVELGGTEVVKVTVQPWCNSSIVTFNIKNDAISIGDEKVVSAAQWLGGNSKATPWTPFNGTLKDGNPYLFVSKAGKQLSWVQLLNKKCVGIECGNVEFDPAPYTQAESYYVNGQLVGTQINPFIIEGTNVYAHPNHYNEWATRWISGVQEWGQFSTPVGTLGYKYVKRY